MFIFTRLAVTARLSFLLILSALALCVSAQTNPTPQSLPYTQDFGTASFSVLPSGMASWNGLNGGNINTQGAAENSAPTGNATVGARTSTTTTGGSYGYMTLSNARFYIQTSSNNTNGVNQLVLSLNTTGRQNIEVDYDLEMLSIDTRTIGVVMQYRIGTSGTWTTVPSTGNPYVQVGGSTGLVASPSITLPSAADNQPVVQIRWAIWRGAESGSSAGLAIDNISANGSLMGPDIVVSTNSIPDFGSVQTGSSSAEETFDVSATGLTDTLHINAPADFEISLTSGSGFSSSLFILPVANTVSPVTIYVRFSPQANGPASGVITNTSTGATQEDVAVSGTGSSCAPPEITVSGSLDLCPGDNVTLTSSAADSYLWSTGETTQSIIVDEAGDYSVTVTDASNCTSTSTIVTVTENTFSFTGVLFYEDNGVPTSNTNVNTYSGWTNFGLVTFSSPGTAAADVRATQQSNNYTGASAGGNVFLGNATNTERTFIISGINSMGYATLSLQFGLFRNNTSTSLTVEVSEDGNTWSPLTFTQPSANSWTLVTATGIIPASENLHIRFYKLGSTEFRIDDITLTGTAESVSITTTGDTTICGGGSVVLVSNIPDGNLWTPGGETTASITVSTAGTYFTTVTAMNGCSVTSNTITVSVNNNPSVSVTGTDPSCGNGNDGTATANVTGGLAPYEYAWSALPVQTTETATGLYAGTHSVVVTDMNGCSDTGEVTLNNPPLLTLDITSTNVSCAGENDGTATAVATSGTGPFTYTWDLVNDSTTFDFEFAFKDATHPFFNQGDNHGYLVNGVQSPALTLVRGTTYHFNIISLFGHPVHISTDSVGGNFDFEITDGVINSRTVNGVLTFTPNANHPDLLYYTDGNHELAGYRLNIVDGVSGDTQAGLAAGGYTVTVTDANGCTGSAAVNITEPAAIVITSFDPDTAAVGATVIINGSGFTGATDVSFDGTPASFTVDNDTQITATVPAGAGTGTITVTVNGCTGESTDIFHMPGQTVTLNVFMLIQGYFDNGSTLLPPLLYNEGISPDPTACDSIEISLMDGSTMVESFKGILSTNGSVSAQFTQDVLNNSYYIRVRHHNALETWSAAPVLLDTLTYYDFTVAASQAYGSKQVEVMFGVFALYSGDVFDATTMQPGQDGIINHADFLQIEGHCDLVTTGYSSNDITGNGIVESDDYSMVENNTVMNVTTSKP